MGVAAALLTACGVPTTPDASRDGAANEVAAEAAAPLDGGEDSGCGAGTQRACYSGPAGTSGVGVCRPGVQRCFEGAWGPCVGEATPASEVCGNRADDDCDGIVDCSADAGPEASDATTDAPDARANCVDGDRDGYGMGSGCLGTDCNDSDPFVHPGAPERCNGADDNCDGSPETAANAPALDSWCRDNAPGFTDPANWREIAQCDGPGRLRTNPPDPGNMRSFACRICYRFTSPPFDVACSCWRSPTDRRPCSEF
jgi:hypothetical protein